MDPFFPLAVGAVLGVGVTYLFLLIATRESFLYRLCGAQARGSYRAEPPPPTGVFGRRACIFDGRYGTLQVQIRYNYYLLPKLKSSHHDDLQIEIPVVQKFWLRLMTERSRPAAEDEIETWDEFFQSRLVIHSNQPEAAANFLSNAGIRQQILLCGTFHKMEIYRGWLKLTYGERAITGWTNENLDTVVSALMLLVEAYQSQTLFRIVSVRAHAICPYCRDRLKPVEEQIVECKECGARMHQPCREQNGQCTTWGCRSESFHDL